MVHKKISRKKKEALVLGVILKLKGRTIEQLRETFVSGGIMTEEELQKCLESLVQEGFIRHVQPEDEVPSRGDLARLVFAQ